MPTPDAFSYKHTLQRIYLRARLHPEGFTTRFMVYGCHGPRHSNTKEDIHCIATRHITDTRIRRLILYGSHFTGECIWNQYSTISLMYSYALTKELV